MTATESISVVIDDGLTDATAQIVSELSSNFPDTAILYRHPKNGEVFDAFVHRRLDSLRDRLEENPPLESVFVTKLFSHPELPPAYQVFADVARRRYLQTLLRRLFIGAKAGRRFER